MPGGPNTRRQARVITAHHTDPVEAGQIFARVQPKLAVFSHGGTQATLPYVRQKYSGPVEIGEDMMTIEIGDKIEVRRFSASAR
jgi:ribonuclease Z